MFSIVQSRYNYYCLFPVRAASYCIPVASDM